MRFLAPFIVVLAFSGCDDAKVDSNATESVAKEEAVQKDFLTEIITRTYTVEIIDNEAEMGALKQIQSITNDSKGKEIESTFYNEDLTPKWIEKYNYDTNGNKIGADYFDKGTNNTIYYKYDLDDQGRRTFYRAYDKASDALLYNGATFYEDSGKLKKDGYVNDKGGFICNFEYVYDENGKEKGYVYIDNLSNKKFASFYEYVDYNEDNQWIKRHVTSDGAIQSIETREFIKKEIDLPTE